MRDLSIPIGTPRPLAWLLAALLLLACLGLSAQTGSEEFELVKSYVQPKSAVPIAELSLEDELYLQNGEPFTGVAYELFASRRLSRVLNLFEGRQQGPTYVWYPDGAPLMSAQYNQGRLQGRFLGWYQHGGVIYDMVINSAGYAGDFIGDDRAQASDQDSETDQDADNDAKE